MAGKETKTTTPKKVKEKPSKKASEENPEEDNKHGGIPNRNLKKNLGCG